MRHLLAILSLFILIGGCVDRSESEPAFVVEGYLFAGESVKGIKIKRQTNIDEPDSVEYLIEDAEVKLIKDAQEYLLYFENGSYKYDGNDLTVAPGDEFRIEVTVENRMAYAETVVPEVTSGLSISGDRMIIPTITLNFGLLQQLNKMFFEIRLTARWDNPEERLHFISIEPTLSSADPIFPPNFPQNGKDFLSGFKFAPAAIETDTFSIIGIAFENYGQHKVKVYRVNQEYADLFNNPKQDSRDLTSPPSNVVNGLGIFSAFAADSVYFTIQRN